MEWKKAALNKRKHGITFSTAVSAFLDDDALFKLNSVDENTGEERFSVTGIAYPVVLFVIYVERVTIDGEDVFRIISARRATKEEEYEYDYGYKWCS